MPNEQLPNRNENWNILVIDDSKLSRAIVRKTLSKMNMSITEARDGKEGLEILSKNSFDLILLDIVMPNLDGFGFLEMFKESIKDEFIPVILMTGLDDLNSKIKGLNIGADDFLLKPLNDKELIARVQSLLRLKSAYFELYKKNQLIKKELESAKMIQQFVIPKNFSYIEYPAISGRYLPIDDIGGDFFDCYQLFDNDIGFIIADVTGHGIPAALVMAMLKMTLNVFTPFIDSTSSLLYRVNKEMRGLLLDDQYITAFYIIFNADSNTISFSNAGHSRPLYYRKKTGRVLALDTDGLFIGIKDDTEYEEKKLNIERGDSLLLYTDGITEIKNSDNVEFGENRLATFIKENRNITGDDFCEMLLNRMRDFTSLDARDDDIAFLNIEF
jgi:serine phosphatase RsbU (regulator of sigma subunit)